MEDLITLLKTMTHYAHNMHNLTKGSTFLQDHDFLAELYANYETEYDDCVERSIGLGFPPNLQKIHIDAAQTLSKLPHNENVWRVLLNMEKLLREEIAKITPTSSIGTQQMIGNIADKSEVRSYKLTQRSKV